MFDHRLITPFTDKIIYVYMVTRNIKEAHLMGTLSLAIWDNRNCSWWYKK